MIRSETTAKLAAALAKAQGKFKKVKKSQSANYNTRSQGQMAYDFADLAAHLEAVTPALSKNGLALMTPATPVLEGACPRALAVVRLEHESGEFVESDPFTIPIMDPTDARSIGSACSYARKYAVQGFLGIHPAEEDDDGEAARGHDNEQARRPAQRQEREQPQRASQQPQPKGMPVAELAKQLERDARDVQTRRDALETGIPEDGYRAWVEQMLAHPIPPTAAWNRTLTDDERQILEDEVRARRELEGAGGAKKSGAKMQQKRGPVQDPPRIMTVVDAVEGTTKIVSSSPSTVAKTTNGSTPPVTSS
jgi:hypothetical protein